MTMRVSLPTDKVEKIVTFASEYLEKGGCTADELRSFLGRLESVRPVVEQAPLHYRSLKYALRPLRKGLWHGRKFLPLTTEMKEEILWWKTQFPTPPHLSAPLRRPPFTVVIMADASGNFGLGVIIL